MTGKISVGSDPEFVIKNERGEVISAPNALNHPEDFNIIKTQTRFGDIFPDNANLEMSPNPGKTEDEFVKNIEGCIKIASKLIGPNNKLYAIPSLEYPKTQLEHLLCRKFGCFPDFNSYSLDVNIIESSAVESPFRSAGGHIHIGNVKGHEYLYDPRGKINTVKTFELMAGVPGLLLDHTKDSIKRRTLYGGAGNHRAKPYGVECRSLSNFWAQSPELTRFAFKMTQATTTEALEKNIKIDLDSLQPIINNGDVNAAKELMKTIRNHYPNYGDQYDAISHLSNSDKNISINDLWL